MKIRDIYLNKKVPVVSIVFALCCILLTVLSGIFMPDSIIFKFNYPVQNPWQFVTYVFQHYTPQYQIGELPGRLNVSAWELSLGHLAFNMLLVIPFGILVEKVIGCKKFLILTVAAWLLDVTFIYVMAAALLPSDATFSSNGASGLAFSYMPVGLWVLFNLGKKFGFGKLFKQISFYFLMPIAITTIVFALSPNIAGATTVWSMYLHLIAVAVGIIFAVVFRKTIRGYFDNEENAKT